MHILSPAQPGSSHAATIEVVGKAALDDLGAQLEGLAGDPGLEPRTVVGDRAPRRLHRASAKSRSAWAPRSGSSRDCRSEPSRPPVSDNLCRRHIQPGPPTSVPHPPPRGLPRPSPGSWKASWCRPHRPGAARPPPPCRCPDPPRARACRPDASCRPSSWRSWPRGRSSKPNPCWKASWPCASAPDAPGSLPWVSRRRFPGPGAPASPGSLRRCRAARCSAAPRWPPWSRHRRRCARP